MTYRLRGKELAFIRSREVARVATVDERGAPQNVPVCPVAVNGRIYFASEASARKVINVRSNSNVALAFDHYTDNWKQLAGVMIEGTATIIERGAMFRRVRQALYRKYKPYARVAPVEEGESVIVCVTPANSFSWGL